MRNASQGRRRTGRIGRCALALAALSTVLTVPVPAAAVPAASARAACGPAGDHDLTRTPWPLLRLAPTDVWHLSRGGGVEIAVIDSGVSDTHPSLRGQVLPGIGFGDLNANAGRCDEAGHGTMVAGIIAGRQLPTSLFYGVAPDARILPIRVLREEGKNGDPALPKRIADAIVWAVDKKVDVINLSLETAPTADLEAAIKYAASNDVVVVAAAGNVTADGVELPAYPAVYDSVLAVAGVDAEGKHSASSVRGDYIDVAAPGAVIEGPAPTGDRFRTYDAGTSFAAAYVTGVVALVRSHYPAMKADQVVSRVRRTADNPPEGRNELVGYGVVNPYRAVTAILGGRVDSPLRPVAPPVPVADPLRTAKMVAPWAAVGGLTLAGLILLAGPVLRRGRHRGWRPGDVA